MLSKNERRQITSGPLFRNAEIGIVERLLDPCAHRTLAVGETLLAPGTENRDLFVVLSGELRVYLGSRDLPEHTTLGIGACAGEMSLIDGQLPSATVVATLETVVLVIPRETVWAMVDASHAIARNLLAIVAGRARQSNLALMTTQSHGLVFEQAVSVDALTGLHNRHWMNETFPRTLRRCEHDAAPLCLIMANIDHFRRINEKHGHLACDSVLRIVSHTIAESLRPQDLLVRSGGDEFVIVLPLTDSDVGMNVANRLCGNVRGLRMALAAGMPEEAVTLSCGVVPFLLGDTLATLLELAEAALAEAKSGGRDCAVLSPERS